MRNDQTETRVKICGLTSAAQVDLAIDAGADYVGFVHFAPSPRHVGLDVAAELAAHARGRAISVVLLVDPSDDLIDRVVLQVAPDVIQLHGSETPARVRGIRQRAGLRLMKAVSVASRADVAGALAHHDPGGTADIILFDAKPPPDAVLPGGNGLAFDWRILDVIPPSMPFALAGGLDPSNVQEAVRRVRPSLVDVSSGVESAPGIKDPARVRAFVAAATAA